MSKKVLLAVFVLVLSSLLLSACSSRFQKDDQLVANEDITVVEDYNTTDSFKPTCTIHEGDSVTITGFSTLNLGSIEKQGLIELTSNDCVGWAYDDSSLNNKLK